MATVQRTKTYFILRDILNQVKLSTLGNFRMKTIKVDGVENLTSAFFAENPIQNKVINNTYNYGRSSSNGVVYTGPLTHDQYNMFNPFRAHFGLNYNNTSGYFRGSSIGTVSGSNYGEEILQFGVDKSRIYNISPEHLSIPFFINIDLSRSYECEFEISLYNSTVASQNSLVLKRTYYIYWNRQTCETRYYFRNDLTGIVSNEIKNGFLIGRSPLQIMTGDYPAGVTDMIQYDSYAIDLPCGPNSEEEDFVCLYGERTISYANLIRLPRPEIAYDEIFSECCYLHYVLADTNSNENYRNDYTSVYYQRQTNQDNCNFYLVRISANNQEILLNNNNLGTYFNYGFSTQNPKLKGFLLQWQKVLSNYGEGAYIIRKKTTIAGQEVVSDSMTYNLRTFTTKRANKTVRIDYVSNGWNEKDKVIFTGTNWKNSLRVGGFFGRREAKYEEDILINRRFEKKQISMNQINEYKFQTNLVPSCITEEILDSILFANEIYMNDYNLNNHSYDYINFGVKFSSNESTEYSVNSRKARLNITFTDYKADSLKRNY